MGTVSLSLPSDGQTIDAADVNTPLNTLTAEFNGNIDNDNIKAAANIDGTKFLAASIPASRSTTAANVETRGIDTIFDHVASGGVWTADSVGVSLNASMSALVCYINGQRMTVSAVTARAFTLNVDTYIDILNTAGVGSVVYTTAATNAASPALAANSIRIGIIQAAATITAVTKVNQGQEDRVFPIATSVAYAVTDSLGNLICPRDPNRRTLGYRQIIVDYSNSNTSAQQVTGVSCPVIVPVGRKVSVTAFNGVASNANGTITLITTIYDGTVAGGTLVGQSNSYVSANNATQPITTLATVTPSTASKTYNMGFHNSGANLGTLSATSARPTFIKVELV